MADRFFDTSAAAKHYRNELGSAKVDTFLAEFGSHHFLSALSIVELHSVLARLVRTGHINAADFHLARGRFLADNCRRHVASHSAS
jgi:predicted nucleic acid-binding protein